MLQLIYFVTVIFNLFYLNNFCSAAIWEEELYGSGKFVEGHYDKNANTHLSSSTEDLKLLFKAELDIVKFVKNLDHNPNTTLLVQRYLQAVDFDENFETDEYVKHPINAFHLLQRTSQWLPKLKKVIPHLPIDVSLPTVTDAVFEASNGLADLLEHYDMKPSELVKGQIKSFVTGEIYPAKSKLTSNEIIRIANAAWKAQYYHGYVSWLEAALETAKAENESTKQVDKILELIEDGKEDHDERFMSIELNSAYMSEETFRINHVPYVSNQETRKQEEDFRLRKNVISNSFHNFLVKKSKLFPLSDYPNRAHFFLRERTQELCRGEFVRPAYLEKELKCIWLHHDNPYLKIAPYKTEYYHRNPEIIYVHDLATKSELEKIKSLARGHMQTTPYKIGGLDKSKAKTESFSRLRTSKIMYMNELLVPEAMEFSRKISQITRFRLKEEKYASENFQVMNYGIGGRISTHLDSLDGPLENSSESYESGGYRITTFMVYLSEVEAGGHTIFPQAGISIKPKEGDALFWFNNGPKRNIDTRIFHMGCPVLYGNKWIANKWIKVLAQFKNYPCWKNKNHYLTTLQK